MNKLLKNCYLFFILLGISLFIFSLIGIYIVGFLLVTQVISLILGIILITIILLIILSLCVDYNHEYKK